MNANVLPWDEALVMALCEKADCEPDVMLGMLVREGLLNSLSAQFLAVQRGHKGTRELLDAMRKEMLANPSSVIYQKGGF